MWQFLKKKVINSKSRFHLSDMIELSAKLRYDENNGNVSMLSIDRKHNNQIDKINEEIDRVNELNNELRNQIKSFEK